VPAAFTGQLSLREVPPPLRYDANTPLSFQRRDRVSEPLSAATRPRFAFFDARALSSASSAVFAFCGASVVWLRLITLRHDELSAVFRHTRLYGFASAEFRAAARPRRQSVAYRAAGQPLYHELLHFSRCRQLQAFFISRFIFSIASSPIASSFRHTPPSVSPAAATATSFHSLHILYALRFSRRTFSISLQRRGFLPSTAFSRWLSFSQASGMS
jgi:hypothetical protein